MALNKREIKRGTGVTRTKGIQRDSSASGTSDGSEALSEAEGNLLCTGHGNTPGQQAGQSS